MSKTSIAVVVLAAGAGTRLKSAVPKVLHPLAGRPMLSGVLEKVSALDPDLGVVVVGPDMAAVEVVARPWLTTVQHDRLGTAHAVLAARDALGSFDGTVLVLFCDNPLIEVETLRRVVALHGTAEGPDVVVLGFEARDPGAYGRLVVGADGGLEAIVEAKEATAEQRQISLCNSGAMAVDGRVLFALLDKVKNDNAKGEYYLTDVVTLAREEGLRCEVVEGDEAEFLGINSRADLAAAEAAVQASLRARALAGGATLQDPGSVWFSHDTILGQDVTVQPNVFFGPGVEIGDNVTVMAFSHLEGARVAAGAVVGPFARLRPGADIGENGKIGNFVEVKNSRMGRGAKANHLTYVGDADVGAGVNIGAGTIFANYDGFSKHRTRVGEGASTGSNSVLVAPVSVGDGAMVAAGSVITHDVADDALGIARGRQGEKPGWAKEYREGKKPKS